MTHTRSALIIIVAFVVAALVPAAAKHSPYRLNVTASEPAGIYQIVSTGSRYAALCLPDAILATAQRAGLIVSAGDCPDGKEPILKTVYRATPEAPITFTAGGFVIGDRLLANTTPKLKSKIGRPLAHEPFGTYRSGLWAISDYNSDSFDSRYFGPVSDLNVRYYVVPVLLFNFRLQKETFDGKW